MIGNDIVDRAQAKRESDWQRSGFLDKLFTPSEQQLIRRASNPECLVWTLWSMKESAYKASTRKTGERVFNPTKLRCTLKTWSNEAAEGFVMYEEEYQTRSLITPDYVASVAVSVHQLTIPHQVIIPFDRTDYQYQSTQLRTSVLKHYVAISPAAEDELRVSRDENGSPVLVIKSSLEAPVCVPVSLSHHGHYGAFCIAHSVCIPHH